MSRALGQGLSVNSAITLEVLGVHSLQTKKLRHRDTEYLAKMTQRKRGRAWMRSQGRPAPGTWPRCGNQHDPPRGQPFMGVAQPAGAGSLCPGRKTEIAPSCPRQSPSSTDSRSSLLRPFHRAADVQPVGREGKPGAGF